MRGHMNAQRNLAYMDVTSPASYRYIRDSLSSGLQLGRLVNDRWSKDRGRIDAMAPPNTPIDRLNEFSVGGVLAGVGSRLVHGRTMSPTPSANADLAQGIRKYVSDRANALVVIEDAEGYLTTPAGAGVQDIVRSIDRDIYAFISKELGALDDVIQSLQAAYSLPFFNTIWAEVPHSVANQPSEAELEDIAEHTRRVVVGAYDGESYLVWTLKP